MSGRTASSGECEDMLLLRNQLCFPIYACAREVIKAYHEPLSALNLTYTQYLVMMVLWEEKKKSVRELGDCLYLDSGTLTPLLKKMEAKGYIVREQNEQDKREYNVRATGRYREEYGEIFDYIHTVCDRIEERFSPEEVENFSNMLGIISEELMPEAGTRLRERGEQ